MKKVISVLLAAVMVACCVPFTVFAASNVEVFSSNGEFVSSDCLVSDTEYIIESGYTMTVPSGTSVYLPSSAKLVVQKGATLNLLDSLIILGGGELWCYGTIVNAGNVKLDSETSVANVEFRFPNLNDNSIKLADKVSVSVSYGGDTYDVPATGFNYNIPLNSEVRINAHIDEPVAERDKFDDSLLKLSFASVPLPYVTGATEGTGYFKTTATTGGDVSYAKWTNDSNFLTTKKIILPSGEGYECVSRYPVNRTEDGTIIVKYGDPFSFKVELDEAYDMSNCQVYIYNGYGYLNLLDQATGDVTGFEAHPDAYGYYNISEVNTDLTVTVTGVMKNSTINLIGNLLDTFRNIFNMLKEFFEGIKDLFNAG